MKRADFERAPCVCGECVQAGVSERPQLRDPHSGAWLHGYDLKRTYDAADRCLATFKRIAESTVKGVR